MYILNYYKKNGSWFLEKPSHAPWLKKEDLERTGSFYNFLEHASGGEPSLIFYFDLKPFAYADKFCCKTIEDGEAQYEIEEFEGRPFSVQVKLGKALLAYSGQFPDALYIRRWSTKDIHESAKV